MGKMGSMDWTYFTLNILENPSFSKKAILSVCLEEDLLKLYEGFMHTFCTIGLDFTFFFFKDCLNMLLSYVFLLSDLSH